MAEKYRLNRDPNPEEREKKKRLEAEKLKAIDDDMAKIKSKHDHGVLWTNAEKINAYTNVYELVINTSVGPDRDSVLKKLEQKYESILEERVFHKVLPSLRKKKDTESEFVEELNKQWSEYKQFTKDVMIIFYYPNHDHSASSHYSELSTKWFFEQVHEAFAKQISEMNYATWWDEKLSLMAFPNRQ